MVEGGGRLRLPEEALAHTRVFLELVREEFQGDVPFEGGVAGQIDLAHAAFSEEPDDLVVLDPVARAYHGQSSGAHGEKKFLQTPEAVIAFPLILRMTFMAAL